MEIVVQKSFEKDISAVTDKKLAAQILTMIEQLEICKSLSEINHVKKMKVKGDYYRIRIGNYRLGLKLGDKKIFLLRFMHRKDIYNYFP